MSCFAVVDRHYAGELALVAVRRQRLSPTFPEEPTMDWSFDCLDSVSPGSTGSFKTDFLSVTRFDKVTFDSEEEDFLASRLAGSTSPLVCSASDRMVVDSDLGLLHVALCFAFRGLRNFFFRSQICLAELQLLG